MLREVVNRRWEDIVIDLKDFKRVGKCDDLLWKDWIYIDGYCNIIV